MELAVLKFPGVCKLLIGPLLARGPLGASAIKRVRHSARGRYCLLPPASALCVSITVFPECHLYHFNEARMLEGGLDCPLSYKEWNSWLRWVAAFIWSKLTNCLIEHERHKCKTHTHTHTLSTWCERSGQSKKVPHERRVSNLWSRWITITNAQESH